MSWADCGGFPRAGIRKGRGDDLAWSVLDSLATGEAIQTTVRDALYQHMRVAVDAERWGDAAVTLQAFLDTWALAELVDGARACWSLEADGAALTVLGRAAAVIGLAMSWPVGPWGPWPIPDADWREAGVLVPTPVPERAEFPVAALTADELVERRGAVVGGLVRGELSAVAATGEPGDPVAYALAMGEVRLEAPEQHGFDRYGYAAIGTGEVPEWGELLHPAKPGVAGPVLKPLCEGILLPGPVHSLARGEAQTVGWLLFGGPHPVRAVQPAAVQVLQQLDGERSCEQIREALGAPEGPFQAAIQGLLQVGAATARSGGAS